MGHQELLAQSGLQIVVATYGPISENWQGLTSDLIKYKGRKAGSNQHRAYSVTAHGAQGAGALLIVAVLRFRTGFMMLMTLLGCRDGWSQ